ncbi:uncharacterized protein LOC110987568 isoform X2 [Acanthaster planci]|nr:uncharacterized protein LOC110987568 isoform X2 [Acanthaster planci]XP_022106087.1 uncharacterized protein LOC110987568 isoform X2 [Acanthaster planci]XP_022106088.1 uncharacterized protein LOC110987568 isoform X2 [Acanthaster planci]XP_022106089.1 uncharacterized protein LOC110987568 isoform X2 [Acanthaster planci]XP_022106090.1 uncharacterized protein LOC110987568 isoform X2 [Acanthaster planci]XP_022106091.1 uncharacterized protein LOC110987568 isoform X2 [Acanthaster planci]
MATGVASNSKLAVHDGKNDNSPSTTGNSVEVVGSVKLDVACKKSAGSTEQQDDSSCNSSFGGDGSMVHCGQPTSEKEDVVKDDATLPNGGQAQHQTGSTSHNITSCYCPHGPLNQPGRPNINPRPIPRKPQTRVLPPKLPPKPPHLLRQRSPSSDNLMGNSNHDKQGQGRDKRSQSVSVVNVHSPPSREDFSETKLFKRPVPTPRKSLPNIFPDRTPSDMKSLEQASAHLKVQKPDSEMTAAGPAPEPQSPFGQGEMLSPRSERANSSPVHRRDIVKKNPSRSSKPTQHVRVRERAAIFEKMIEVEAIRNRDSQSSEPRSRTSSRASDFKETSGRKLLDASGNVCGSSDRYHPYVNIQLHDGILLSENIPRMKDAFVEDETLSVTSVSSDDLFMLPQSSMENQPHRPPSPNLSEDEYAEDLKDWKRKSSNTEVFLRIDSSFKETKESNISHRGAADTYVITTDSDAGDSEYTDIVIPDPVVSQNNQKSNVLQISNSKKVFISKPTPDTQDLTGVNTDSESVLDSDIPQISDRESDYTDVIVPDCSTSQDSTSPKVALDTAEPSVRHDKPRFSLPTEQKRTSYASELVRHDMLSPEHAPSLPKPFHGVNKYRNVTPLFCFPPRQAETCDTAESRNDTESAKTGPAHKHQGDVIRMETDQDQEGMQMRLTDNLQSSTNLPLGMKSQMEGDDQQQADRVLVTEDTAMATETSNMLPEPCQQDQHSKSHPTVSSETQYEVWLPDSIDPISLKKQDGVGNVSPMINSDVCGSQIEKSQVAELYEKRSQELPDIEGSGDGDGSDMLCNRSRRQRLAVKKRESNSAGHGQNKWQYKSAPASLGGLERQEAITELHLPPELSCQADGNKRHSQESSGGSTISSLISNVSIGDTDQLSSDEEDYDDVHVPSSDVSDADVPRLPPLTEPRDREVVGEDARPQLCKDVRNHGAYSTLYEVRCSKPVQEEDSDVLLHGDSEDEDASKKDEEDDEKDDQVPIEIEMQPMRTKFSHSPEKETRRKAFEFHIPLFLRKSSSIESTMSAPNGEERSSHSLTIHSEDSDMSSDYLDEVPPISGTLNAKYRCDNRRDSSTSHELSEDGLSSESEHRVSMDSLNLSVQSELQASLRRRGRKNIECGRPFSEYDRPVSSVLTEYDRPASDLSTEYDRPVSSTSADYIGVLDSFHKDGKKNEDSEGFSFTWTLDHSQEGTQQDDSYRPKSEELPQTTPAKYALPRKASHSTQPVPVLPVPPKALKPPKVPRPYSEPSLKKSKRNSLVKNLLVPSKEEITEQFCKISRQRSRFVSQEPLFQLYQEDARSRDSYLRLMNISSLEALTKFLENQEALKKEKRESLPIPIPSQQPEYRVLIPDEEVYCYQSAEQCRLEEADKDRSKLEDANRCTSRSRGELGEAIYQSAEPVYEPPGELYYDTGNLLQNNTIYEPGSLGSSTGDGSGGSSSDVDIPKPYGLMQLKSGASAVRRSFWSELPEVINSGLLEQMTSEEKRLQEALFEVITSEASYLRSLNLVVEHFLEAITLQPPTGLLNKVQHHRLFSNIKGVRDASERLLLDLEERQQDSIIITDVCDILLQHFEKGGFNCYIVYCANNQYQVKTLEELRKNPSFVEVLKLLESSPACCSLDLQSFLMLPFQRITRLPLLIEAIRQQAKIDSPLHSTAIDAVKALRNMAEKCNEEAKRMEMIEEVTQLANQLDFREGVKKMNLSQTTSIVKRGHLHIIKKDNKILNRGKLIAKGIYIIVFTDKVAICKQRMKGEQLKYEVFDWCPRNLVQVDSVVDPQQHPKLPDGVPSNCKHVFIISFLQNNQKKEVEFAVDANSEAERERWMDAMHPAKRTEDGETIYESWG